MGVEILKYFYPDQVGRGRGARAWERWVEWVAIERAGRAEEAGGVEAEVELARVRAREGELKVLTQSLSLNLSHSISLLLSRSH